MAVPCQDISRGRSDHCRYDSIQRLMGEVLGHDPVGIVFAGNSTGNIHSIQDMDCQVYGLVADVLTRSAK